MDPVEAPSVAPFAEAARRVPEQSSRALSDVPLPGDAGGYGIGHFLQFLFGTQSLMDAQRIRHGANFRLQMLGMPVLILGSPDAVRELLLDRDKNFSSERGWGPNIGELFARGLMLRDFEEHRTDRRIMQVAFRTEAMRGYVDTMNRQVGPALGSWPQRLRLYPALKQLTLDLAGRIFLGLGLGPDSASINRAFVAAVAASIAIVRRELPLTAYGRGMRGRRLLEQFFGKLIRERRQQPGVDLLSELCSARSEQGERFSDAAISDQMIFLMMAAHDTTTSSLSSVVHLLIENPDWQERVRDEIRARGGAPLGWDDRAALPLLDRCFDEAIRLYPPAPFIVRRSVRNCSIAGLEVPANSALSASSLISHRLPEYWSTPARFDPDRFSPGRAEHTAHSHLYYPFGGGAHICLGLHFARIQVKVVLSELLGKHRIRAQTLRRSRKIAAVPIPYPRDGLPIVLEPIR